MKIWIGSVEIQGRPYEVVFGYSSEDDPTLLTHLSMNPRPNVPWVGDRYGGTVLGPLSARQVMVNIQRPHPLLMPTKHPFPQGTRVEVEVTREEIENPLQPKGAKGIYIGETHKEGLIQRGMEPRFKMILDLQGNDIQIITQSLGDYESLKRILKVKRPDLEPTLKLTPFPKGDEAHLKDWGIEGLGMALETHFSLPDGGHGIVEETLGATVIDINTSGIPLEGSTLTLFQEVARQIRLRRLGGLILLDWPTTASQGHKEILAGMKESLSEDKGVQVFGWTRGGLLEIMAPRKGPSLRGMIQLKQ